ncbi:hypothetical protein DM05_2414 [Pseudomonas poae]|uniref:Uncharacterized protein n=1 Tax=Pseudomonas poae TaxID=200451 RepID=A0A7Z1GY81_9PSED|nr:hypothetical protein [Pseudomonas poae]PFG72035.1 hypothetical protein DM05_2414 [Pseudomonas poae]
MINVRPSHTPGFFIPKELNLPTKPAGSVTPQVIELFLKRLNGAQPMRASAQASDIPLPDRTRIEQLLRFAVTKEQPSLDEQISQLIKNTREPLTDVALHNEVGQRLNQSSAINPQKTYAQLIQEILDGASPSAPNTYPAPPRLSRKRRDISSTSAPRIAPVRQFAEALVENGDRQLAIGVANSLMRQRLAVEKGHSGDAEDKVTIPADSTFGHAWTELADALHSEPFKSFAEARKLDLSQLTMTPEGRLIETGKEPPADFSLGNDARWAAASGAVLAAVKRIAGDTSLAVDFHGRNQASAFNVAAFYGLQLGQIESDHTLLAIGQLLSEGNFHAFNTTDPNYATVYAPVKQRQREAGQRIMDLPPDQLKLRLEQFTPSSVEQKVQEADRALAHQCSQAMLKLTPQLRIEGDDFPPVLKEVPKYSTFNQVRKNLLDALTGSAFTTFAQENNVEARSVRIHPVTGELTGKVNGKDTLFKPNDLSGWGGVWAEIADAIRQMAAGAERPVRYPSPPSASLYEVMWFYKEEIPRQQNGLPALVSLLDRSIEMTGNNGFKAFTAPHADSTWYTAVRERQYAITQQLADTPTTGSELETLAAAVESGLSATVESAPSPQDALASAESALATATYRAMHGLKNNPAQASTRMIGPIPADSLLGQWCSYLDKAIKARGFTEWAEKHKVDLTSLRFDPDGEALIGKIDGVDRRFAVADFAKNHPEHFDVLAPVLSAARVFATPGRPITLSQASSNTVPLDWVGRFYGITTQPGSQAFDTSMTQLDSMKMFPRSPDHPEQMVNWLNQQKTALGDSNDRYALINQLKQGNLSNDDTTRFIVDPDSSHRPKGETTVQKFLADQGWFGATSAAQVDNLLLALQTPTPQAPTLGNNWGFLATDLPLSTAQREAVSRFVKQSIVPHPNLFSYLSAQPLQLSSSPAQALDQLLSSDSALELATNLQTEMKGAVTSTSLKQWLLTAWVLELDPAAGTQRNHVAGYDFMQAQNWGRPAHEIRQGLALHLDHPGAGNVPTPQAMIAAHLLMSGAAPQFLVKDLPPSLVQGTPQWAMFHTAVNRIEQIAPGATRHMNFKQVMDYHKVKPLSAHEQLQLLRAQMNPLIDWGIINGVIGRNANDEYTPELLQACIKALGEQTTAVAEAKRYIKDNPVPTRRALALEYLEQKFGNGIPYEQRSLWRESDQLYGTLASVVEAYEAEQLGDTYKPTNLIDSLTSGSTTPAWEARDARIPIQAMHDQANQLPDVNTQYDAAIESDFVPRRAHSIVIIKDLLSRLPAEVRNHLANGRIEYYSVRESDTSAWQHLSAKTGKKGSHGLLLRATGHNGNITDVAVFPDAGTVKTISNLPNPMPLGGTNKNFGKIYDGADEGPHELPLDFAAFNSAAAPRDGKTSKVIVDRITPSTLVNGELVNDGRATFRDTRSNAAPAFFNEQLGKIATICVDSHFLRKDEYKAINHGYNALETKGPTFLQRLSSLARMVPGVSSVEDLYQGNYAEAGQDLLVDALSIVVPGALGKVWSVAAEAFEGAAVKFGETVVESAAEKGVASMAVKDVTAVSTVKSFGSVSRMQGSPLVDQAAGEWGAAADRADGALIQSGSAQQIRLTAVRQDGEWYAYDAKTMTAYGPALEGFVSDTSSVVRQETFSDGTQALVTEKPLAADAYTLPRSHGFDLVNEGKVYRYDTRTPGVLSDLESADHFKPLEGFEAICPAPPVAQGKVRRGASDTCFSKEIEIVAETSRRELQALEHQRLFPSTPGLLRRDQFVIFERRRYKMVDGDMGPQLVPMPQNKPIVYKSQISGSLKHDPNFGFSGAHASDSFAKETRVVTLNKISDDCNDKRELRGVIVERGASKTKYLVIEADTAEFYYTKLNDTSTGELTFNKCTPHDFSLVEGYRNAFSTRQGVTEMPFDANFIALPKLDSAFKELERSGFQKEDIDQLKASCKGLTHEQQREVIYQLQRTRAIGKPDIALRPNQVTKVDPPDNFADWTQGQKNEFYAVQAKNSVDRIMKATGLGPGNMVRSKADMARAEAANMTNEWLRRTVPEHALNRPNLILKAGAGNCGEMALLSKDIIEKNGGSAYEWHASDAHAFTFVGGPSTLPQATVDFSEPAWADAWIVDAWADIVCPASQYTQKLSEVMKRLSRENVKILEGGKSIDPLDPTWLEKLIVKPKTPYSHGYIGGLAAQG